MTTPGKEQVKTLSITVASGSGTGTISNQWDIANRIRVIPVAEADTYAVNIKDADGHLIFQRSDQLGTLSELQELSLGIAQTVNISGAAQDGAYVVKFDMHA